MTHPYSTAEDYQFWSRSMSWPPAGHIDPVVVTETILPTDRVATMGSCFAQHIARHLARSGCNYFVTEKATAELDESESIRRNYGAFSARYGNIYTVRQAVQLFDRAFGYFIPNESTWKRGDKFVDPFRPQVEPDGYKTIEQVENDRSEHLSFVREVF
jgi:hypothetical protein